MISHHHLPNQLVLLFINSCQSPTKRMESKKSNNNKITEIVRLQQMLKKWKKLAVTPKSSNSSSSSSSSSKKNGGGFLKRTLSFTDASSAGVAGSVPKGYLAVCVGEDLRRFVIPTEYLSHRAFVGLLRDAEEEFGFQQEGVLRIPCEVAVFEKVLRALEEKKKKKQQQQHESHNYYCSAEVGWLSPTTLRSQCADD